MTKLSPDGSGLVYSTYLGGSYGSIGGANGPGTGSTGGSSIATDPSGSAYVTGQTDQADFPTSAGAVQSGFGSTDNKGERDAFVTKLSPDGTRFDYSTFLHGSPTPSTPTTTSAMGLRSTRRAALTSRWTRIQPAFRPRATPFSPPSRAAAATLS